MTISFRDNFLNSNPKLVFFYFYSSSQIKHSFVGHHSLTDFHFHNTKMYTNITSFKVDKTIQE